MSRDASPGANPARLVEAVRGALREVIDPELGVNVVDLGLVYGITAEGGRVEIVMTMTTPGCRVQGLIEDAAREAALVVPGVEEVEVRVVFCPAWSPELMSDELKRRFGFA